MVKLGKCDDSNLDVTRSSSLPTLLISIVRNIVKSDVKVPEVLSDLVENISLLCKNSFNKQVGIEPIFMKGFIPLLLNLIKDTHEGLRLSTLKALGTFSSLAAIIPLRMQPYFKEIDNIGVIADVCSILKTMQNSNITALHMVAVQVISTLVSPVYGDFYSFPWKRGPHDNILEYTEASNTFESVRESIFNQLKEFDFVGKTIAVFQKEDETKYVEVKCCVLRLYIQLLRTFDNKTS